MSTMLCLLKTRPQWRLFKQLQMCCALFPPFLSIAHILKVDSTWKTDELLLYSQLYIYNPAEALQYRENNNPRTDPALMAFLQDLLRDHPFAPLYEQARHLCENTALPSYRLRLDFFRAMDA